MNTFTFVLATILILIFSFLGDVVPAGMDIINIRLNPYYLLRLLLSEAYSVEGVLEIAINTFVFILINFGFFWLFRKKEPYKLGLVYIEYMILVVFLSSILLLR